MSKGRKLIYGLFAIIIILSLNITAFAQDGGGFTPVPGGIEQESAYDLEVQKAPVALRAGQNGMVGVIVKLDVAPVASYEGGVEGLPATSPKVTGKERIDPNGPEERQYQNYVQQQIGDFEARVQAQVPAARVINRYDLVFGGMSMVLPVSELSALATVPGVKAIYPDELRKPDTDRSPEFVGATTAWAQLGGQESAGEGVVVGILDTGIWPEHPSFSDPDPSGKPYAEPPASFTGTACAFGSATPGDASFTCNNKLIAAYRFMAGYEANSMLDPAEFRSARDDDGHGTHTASTSAGNAGVPASIFGVSRGTVSGIAPRAHVAAYKVCGLDGCYSSDSMAAIQQAIADGVNVINFSISGGSNPYSDGVEQAFLDAYNAGVFVSTSAGNSGPGADTVAHRGPWVMTVAASTHDRFFKNTVTLTAGDGATLSVSGASITNGIFTPTDVVTTTDTLCLNPLPAAQVSGKIVLCQRGSNGRVAKGYNVMQGGGIGMILYNPAATTDLETDNHFIPTSHMNWAEGSQVLAFLGSHSGVKATMTAGQASTGQGDVLASFSSRGGTGQTLGVNKPDITAPGVQILAGASPMHVDPASGPNGELFQAIAGTSMSSPHVAGAGALIKAMHPDWTPGKIKSALMTSAFGTVFKDDGVTPATPFEVGSGRLDLRKAGQVGITFDETGANYLSLEDELWNANYPSLFIPVMPGLISVSRTVHSEMNQKVVWGLRVQAPADVSIQVPAKLTVPARGNAKFSITIDASAVPLGEVRHAMLFLHQGKQELRFPITIIRRQPAVSLNTACNPADFPKNTKTSCSITMANTTFDEALVGLVDRLPNSLQIVPRTVQGGAIALDKRLLIWAGKLAGAGPSDVSIAEDPTVWEYLPLSLFGIAPIASMGDEAIVNFNVPAFTYAGKTYTRLGLVSNGYLVVGGGTGADVNYLNQSLPNATPPNNVLAPYWTDLNPSAGGAIRIGTLTDGVNDWLIVDYENVPEFGTGKTVSFQVWIGINGVEDIGFNYGVVNGNGDGGLLTVGAENEFGNRGQNYYYNGTGTLPTPATLLRVSGIPGTPGETKVITFEALGLKKGPYRNCPMMTSDLIAGVNVICATGTISSGGPNDLEGLAEDMTLNDLFLPFVTRK